VNRNTKILLVAGALLGLGLAGLMQRSRVVSHVAVWAILAGMAVGGAAFVMQAVSKRRQK